MFLQSVIAKLDTSLNSEKDFLQDLSRSKRYNYNRNNNKNEQEKIKIITEWIIQ